MITDGLATADLERRMSLLAMGTARGHVLARNHPNRYSCTSMTTRRTRPGSIAPHPPQARPFGCVVVPEPGQCGCQRDCPHDAEHAS